MNDNIAKTIYTLGVWIATASILIGSDFGTLPPVPFVVLAAAGCLHLQSPLSANHLTSEADVLDFYRQYSTFTDPGTYVYLYENLLESLKTFGARHFHLQLIITPSAHRLTCLQYDDKTYQHLAVHYRLDHGSLVNKTPHPTVLK